MMLCAYNMLMKLKGVGRLSVAALWAIGLLVFTLLLPEYALTAVPSPTAAQLDAALQEELAHSQPTDLLRILIHLHEETNFQAIAATTNQLDRRTAVIRALQNTAVTSQSALRQQLAIWQTSGDVTEYHPFWIVNAILVTSTAKLIDQIAARPDVAAITLDAPHRYLDPPDTDYWQLITTTQLLTTAGQQPVTSWGIDRIKAPAAWYGLGVDGSGVTIAIVDSGVDWRHPDLQSNYRGNLGDGSANHAGNWFHAVYPSITEPMDSIGHGTHVAGTAVGQNGIGTAPGANWIAVSIVNEGGFIYDSDIHRGFEWIMAPNGDPALAPDVVNNSWGGSPYSTALEKDVTALQEAGIITVFSAGNNGPFTGTIGSPANLTNTISVAASDELNEAAWFSSRGPSRVTDAQNPWIVAPGTQIVSALPFGRYGVNHGTSMAAPHTSGVIGLLLSANPALSRLEIADILAETAVAIAAHHPNNNTGWGLLDAYAAVRTQVETGTVHGLVHSAGRPLPGTAVTITTGSGANLTFESDENGRYQAFLRPGSYLVSSARFGYDPVSATIQITGNQTTTLNFDLPQQPYGTVSGIVQSTGSQPLTATITVLDTLLKVTTDENGRFQLNLPPNQYKLTAEAGGYQLGRATLLVQTGQTIEQAFTLPPAPTVLLVDGGHWYFDSYADYYRDSLTALNYSFDTWRIRDPFNAVPTLDDLTPYDIVIWSNPLDSPGYIYAGSIISDYLGLGGNLLISGQNVGAYDGSGVDIQHWWYNQLGATFRGKTDASQSLIGADNTNFDGMIVALNAAGSAQNQAWPDVSRPRSGGLAQSTLLFADEAAGGLQAGRCQPFHIAYFGFGLEGVAANDRANLISRSFDYFASPPQTADVQWEQSAIDDFALAGSQIVYTLTVRNVSDTLTDTLHLSSQGGSWPTSLVTETLTLDACQTGQTVLTIDVPEAVPPDVVNTMQLTAVSSNNPAIARQLPIRLKTPGHILLVDDDRWYNQEAKFQAMLDEMQLEYDVWNIGWDNNVRGSPPQALLNAYDIVIWYTAYDWFAPVTAVENTRLTHYLEQGGRLFLTSQDFLYYHRQSRLAQFYLGVAEYSESVEPGQIYGASSQLLPPELAGPLPLAYTPYQNFSDGVIPRAGSSPFLWLDRGMAGATATAGDDWRTIFLSFPLEKLPESAQAPMMNSIVGWLSDLGDSSFAVDQRTGLTGEPRTYTITLRNLPDAPTNQISLTNTLPAGLTLLPGTISGGAQYDASSRQLTWAGQLLPGGSRQIVYQAVPEAGLADGTQLDNKLAIAYDRHALTFTRTVPLWVAAPDLTGSWLTAVTNAPADPQHITYTLHLRNSGQRPTAGVAASLNFYPVLTPTISSLTASTGTAYLRGDRVIWQGDLNPGNQVTITLALTRELSLSHWWQPATAVLNDSISSTHLIYNQLYVPPYTQYFPLIVKNE